MLIDRVHEHKKIIYLVGIQLDHQHWQYFGSLLLYPPGHAKNATKIMWAGMRKHENREFCQPGKFSKSYLVRPQQDEGKVNDEAPSKATQCLVMWLCRVG